MLSEKMFKTLAAFPRSFNKGIRYETLLDACCLTKDEIDECLNETLFPAWNYVRSSAGFRNGSELFLTESGFNSEAALKKLKADVKFSYCPVSTIIS